MITLAFFNNKGGVGKTTLVYHVACMLAEMGIKTLAIDLDPQANLTSAFLDESVLESLWTGEATTIFSAVNPILEGIGDVSDILPKEVRDDLYLICGDLNLSRFEDRLSESWPKGFGNDSAALRTTSAFYRLIQSAGAEVNAAVALMDVGPNLGAINRASLLAADRLLIPLAADLYSLQGLSNLGPIIRDWRADWKKMISEKEMKFALPLGQMAPIGYVVLQHAVRMDRPVKAYRRWLDRIPTEYRKSVMGETLTAGPVGLSDPNCLASLRNYRSLMPLAQDARKPMFELKPSDGAIGSNTQYVQTCYAEFRSLANEILRRIDFHSQ